MKNPLTQARIEPATFRFVAQHLNHCVAAVSLPIVAFAILRTRRKINNVPVNIGVGLRWGGYVALQLLYPPKK